MSVLQMSIAQRLRTCAVLCVALATIFAVRGAAAGQLTPGSLALTFPDPTVDTVNGDVNLGGLFTFANGTGFFVGAANPGGPAGTNSSNSDFYFGPTANYFIGYTGAGTDLAPIDNLISASTGSGATLETYSFSLDRSLTTLSDTVTGPGQQTISFYLLGSMTGSGAVTYDSTYTSLTLLFSLNGSKWTASGLLQTEPVVKSPEPESFVLFGSGLIALGLIRRRLFQG